MNTRFLRTALVAGATSALLVTGGGLASAHVSVNSPGATQGGYSVLTFRVPTESDTAGTTRLEVALPNLKSARTEPMPGWTAQVTKDPAGGAATSVTWTADPGVSVGPGQFQQFVLSAGPLPDEDSVSFAAVQTYSDGKVVAWDQQSDNGAEPEHPAPTLTLAAAADGGDAHGSGAAAATDTGTAAAAEVDATDSTARWLGGIGLVLGALGAALGIGATVRGRRS